MPTLSIGAISTKSPKITPDELIGIIDTIRQRFTESQTALPDDIYVMLNVMDDGRVIFCARQPEYGEALNQWIELYMQEVFDVLNL